VTLLTTHNGSHPFDTWGLRRSAGVDRELTIVIPAFNEALRLPQTLDRLRDDPEVRAHDVEIVVVDDGSTDETALLAQVKLADAPGARVIRLPWHCGKGAAVRLGVAAAHGEAVLFMDADLATDLSALGPLLDGLRRAEVVVGSRVHEDSRVIGRSPVRTAMNRTFSAQAQRLTGVGVGDPQCGFKGFRFDAAAVLFQMARLDGYYFDVEVLLLARRLQYRIEEIPVVWRAMEGSKLRPWRDSIVMALGTVHLGWRYGRRRRLPVGEAPAT
jgi:glycosyltransferase involved in cell wall biosynthesis